MLDSTEQRCVHAKLTTRLRPLLFAIALAGCAGGVVPRAAVPSAKLGTGNSAHAPLVALPVSGQARAATPAPATPSDAYLQALANAYAEFKGVTDGKNADYIPALAKVDSKLFGLSIATVEGAVYEVGFSRSEFSIQSIVAVAPGRFAIGAFSPPLDEAGNSVRSQRAIARIAQELDASVYAGGPR